MNFFMLSQLSQSQDWLLFSFFWRACDCQVAAECFLESLYAGSLVHHNHGLETMPPRATEAKNFGLSFQIFRVNRVGDESLKVPESHLAVFILF